MLRKYRFEVEEIQDGENKINKLVSKVAASALP